VAQNTYLKAIRQAAITLRARGFWPIPIYPAGHQRPNVPDPAEGKEPIGRGWGLKRKTIEEIDRMLSTYPGAGLGIAMGPGRGPDDAWLIDVEGDGPRAEESREKLLGGEIVDTLGWGSARGGHGIHTAEGERLLSLLARCGATEGTGLKAGVHKLPDDLPDLEFRVGGYKANGDVKQVQSVVPPTLATNGKPREWSTSPGINQAVAPLPEAAYAFLERLAEAKEAARSETEPEPDPEPEPRRKATSDRASKRCREYVETAIQLETAKIAALTEGNRHNGSLAPSMSLASLVKSRVLDVSEYRAVLMAAMRGIGLPASEASAIIESGLDQAKPRDKMPDFDSEDPKATFGPKASSNGHHANGHASPKDDTDIEDVEILDRWPKVNKEIFHGLAGEIVAMADPHSEADKVATLAQFLVAFSNMVGRGPHFYTGATRHSLNLFVAIVGATAVGRKGTSWDVVRFVLSQLDPAWEADRIQGGLVSGEGLIYHVRDPMYETKEVKDKKTGVVATERVMVDAGVEDKRLLVIETEMSRVLKAMNRDTNTLSDVIRQGWDNGNLRTLGKQNPAKATNAHISIISHTTTADIQKHLTSTDSENGFGNRFLWACARRSKELPEGGNIFEEDWSAIRNEVRDITSFISETPRQLMKRDSQAREVWAEIYPELSAAKPGLIGKLLSRAEGQVMRLACVYALLDRSMTVSTQHLLSAVALWEYCEASARLIFGDRFGDTDSERLLAALKENPDGLTRTEISAGVFKRHKKAEDLGILLSSLLTQGMIHSRKDAHTGGRTAERWFWGRAQS
jgi:hypothetical protein